MGPSDIVLLCILFVLLLPLCFSSAETAHTFNKLRLRMLVDDGNKKAIVLDKVLSNFQKDAVPV